MKEVKMKMEKKGVRFQEEEREWRLADLLYGDELVMCDEEEEDLRQCWEILLTYVNEIRKSMQVRTR